MTVGFRLSGHDNGGWYYQDSGLRLCDICGRLFDTDWISPTFKTRFTHDLSSTYDGVWIASNALKEALDGVQGAALSPLPADQHHWVLTTTQVVQVSWQLSEMRVDRVCPACERPQGVVDSGLVLQEMPPSGLSRSSVLRGDSYYGPSQPMGSVQDLIADADLGTALKRLGLRMQLDPVRLVS